MPIATSNLVQTIANIKQRGRDSFARENEESLSTKIVRPILKGLGWDHESLTDDDVKTHYRINKRHRSRSTKGDGIVDIALFVRGNPEIYVETKRMGEKLSEWEPQLMGYCRGQKKNTPMGVLTNGFEWRLYLDEVSAQGSNFSLAEIVDIDKGEPADVAKRLEKFLRKDRVLNGDAKKSFARAQKKQYLHKAWVKLFENEGKLLRSVFQKELRGLLGIKTPYLSRSMEPLVREFIKKKSEEVLRQQTVLAPGNDSRKVRGRGTATPSATKPTATKQKPSRFYLFNKEFEFKSWAGAAKTLCMELHRQNPNSLRRLVDLIPSKFALLGSNTKSAHWTSRARPIGDTGILIYLNLYTADIEKLCHEICRVLNLPEKDKIRFE